MFSNTGEFKHKIGAPIPNSEDALSVSLPTIDSVIKYEEGDPVITKALQTGYPRFLIHNEILSLVAKFHLSNPTLSKSQTLPFPSEDAAISCAQFCQAMGKFSLDSAKVKDIVITKFGEQNDKVSPVYMLSIPQELETASFMRDFWQHTGRIVSSRRARDIVNNTPPKDDLKILDFNIRKDIAELSNTHIDSIRLYPSGMAAIYDAYQISNVFQTNSKLENKPTVQFGFPYVDTDKIQSKSQAGRILLTDGNNANLNLLNTLVKEEKISSVFTEFPSNPKLQVPDLKTLSDILRPKNIPLIVDETLASFHNVDLTPFADIIVTSLSKYYSGSATVLAGALLVSDTSPLKDSLKEILHEGYTQECYEGDLAILSKQGGNNFRNRMQSINNNTKALVNFLKNHPAIEKIHFPSLSDSVKAYNAVQKPNGGYGGLFSIELKNPEKTTPIFFDNLNVAKGPSLGTEFTLACPYTLLAHYSELEEVAKSGVSKYLIRVSVGSLEKPEDLQDKFNHALKLTKNHY